MVLCNYLLILKDSKLQELNEIRRWVQNLISHANIVKVQTKYPRTGSIEQYK